MKIIPLLTALVMLAGHAMAAEAAGPELDLRDGKVNGVYIGAPRKEFTRNFSVGGEWIGTWIAFRNHGYFVQPAGRRNMAGFSMRPGSWPDRMCGFKEYKGRISFGISGASTLESVIKDLREKFSGNFVVTLEEERGVWNRRFVAYQLTGWKTDPPFYFDIFFNHEKKIEEIRIKSFPGAYYPGLLKDRALGPHAIDKNLIAD